MCFRVLAACAAFALPVGAASAASLTLTNIDTAWVGHTGAPSTITYENGADKDVLRWGKDRFGGNSSYTMQPVVAGGAYAPDALFDLGTFTHSNRVVDIGILSATLRVSFSFFLGSDPDTLITRSSDFSFSHFETPNVPASGICVNGKESKPGGVQIGCEDSVIPTTNPAGAETFTITQGGKEYRYAFEVTGFNTDGFWTPENGTNSATLQAKYTVSEELMPAPVPLPASGWMLLISFMALLAGGHLVRLNFRN